MTAQTTNERQRALVERRKAAGLKELRNLWTHPEDEAAVREYAAKLTGRRLRSRTKAAP
jgi:hypothetical protein